MNNKTLLKVSAGAIIAGFGLVLLILPAKNDGYNVTQEFVCEDDGRLVERHVGVTRVEHNHPAIWRITYDDESQAIYYQSPGETCKTESYVPPATIINQACEVNGEPVDCDSWLRTKWGGGK